MAGTYDQLVPMWNGKRPNYHSQIPRGIGDEEIGKSLCAHFLPETGSNLTLDCVRIHLSQHRVTYKVLKVVKFVTILPREDSDKIFKRKLRQLYSEGAGHQI